MSLGLGCGMFGSQVESGVCGLRILSAYSGIRLVKEMG